MAGLASFVKSVRSDGAYPDPQNTPMPVSYRTAASPFRVALAFVLLSLGVSTAFARQAGPNAVASVPPPTRNEVHAVYTADAPHIDGRLDEAIWQSVRPITDFTQIWPENGAPMTERSEAMVAYDEEHLYIAFRFFDREPHLIRAKNLERGGRNDKDDHAFIAIDTYLDKRNAYLFEMNAAGTQDDATIQDENMTMDNWAWDAVYRSETQITEEGWTMEVSIPFRQLRFPKGDDLSFGLMLSRTINRKNERAIWPPIGIEFGNGFGAISAVSQYGVVKGLKGIHRGKNIEIKPYVITGAQQVRTSLAERDTEDSFERDLGVDVKVGLSSATTLDLTVNTDFAQVEADNVQLNLDRFSLFFPEKREFFLERSGLFEHGNSRSTQTFFSRRIGLTNQILTGARVTGQVGRLSGGILNIETGDGMGDLFGSSSANNTVARVIGNLSARSSAGAIVTNYVDRDVTNTALGLDAQARFGSASQVSAWYTAVQDSRADMDDAAGHGSVRLQDDRFMLVGAFTSVGKRYAPALGFVRRRDMRTYSGEFGYTPFVNFAAVPQLRRIAFGAGYDYIENQAGDLESTDLAAALTASFRTRDQVTVRVGRAFERLVEPFPIRPDATILPGDYTFTRVTLRGGTDPSRNQFATAGVTFGGFWGGDRTDYMAQAGWRVSQHLELNGGLSHSVIDLPIDNGAFDATTVSLDILAAVNKNLFAKALVQYDNFTRDVQANIRIDWIHTPGSDLFFVFNTAYHLAKDGDVLFDPRRDVVMMDRVGVAKLTYLVML